MIEAPVAPPATPPAPSPAPRRAGWPVRILRGLLAAGFGLLIVVLALVGWLGATQSGLARVAEFAARLSRGTVRIERPEGYLLGQLKLGALHVRTPTLQVDVSDLTLDWRPGAFASRGLDVAVLTAADVQVASVPSAEPSLRVWSLYDIDRPGGGLAWEDANLPPPSWITVNKANGHAHLAYGLTAPVLTSSMEARQAPLRYLNAVEAAFRAKMGGDDGFSGLITKNPAHPLWWTLRGPQIAYELGELAEWVDLEKFKARQGVKVAVVGLGRNVTVFDFVRLWAYKNVRDYKHVRGGFVLWQKAVYDPCLARNADFTRPMDNREAYHIARSVAKWTWTRFDLEASDRRFGALQSFRRTGRPQVKNQIMEFENGR